MNTSWVTRFWGGVFAAVCAVNATGVSATGQDLSCGQCLVYRTIYEQEQVTAYRLQYETAVQEQDVVVSRPQWVLETQERRYTVARPVIETSTREDRYKVMRPVWETETRYQQQVVRKPVNETVMQAQNYVTCEPVTTMRTEYVDRGGFVDQTVYHPGQVKNSLQWLPGTCAVDPATGSSVYQRPGLHWVERQDPGTCTVQRVYVPNVVAQQVPQTNYVQKVVTQQVPVQVTRYVDEVVNQPVAVQVCKWIEQEVVRPVTVSTQRIEYEERVEPVQVQVCRWVTETQKVQVPHQVAKWVPYTTSRLVPRTVAMPAPVTPCATVTAAPLLLRHVGDRRSVNPHRRQCCARPGHSRSRFWPADPGGHPTVARSGNDARVCHPAEPAKGANSCQRRSGSGSSRDTQCSRQRQYAPESGSTPQRTVPRIPAAVLCQYRVTTLSYATHADLNGMGESKHQSRNSCRLIALSLRERRASRQRNVPFVSVHPEDLTRGHGLERHHAAM